MIKSMIEESKDADKIAKLNESVQNLHSERYSEYFKPYSYDSVLQYVEEQLSKDNYHAYLLVIRIMSMDMFYSLNEIAWRIHL